MKYYIIAGEASGDLHGSNLVKSIKKVDPKAEFRAWGGDLMASEGVDLVKHYRDLAFMGFVEVLMNLRTIKKNMSFCKSDIQSYNPDVLILVDYPGFNLRIAEFAKGIGQKVFYYISPKVWAWKQSRVKKIKAFVDRMFVIFPFEIDFFKKHDYPVIYKGNPLLDAVEEWREKSDSREDFLKANQLEEKPIMALLAGSRKQEIDRMLPEMVGMEKHYPQFQFVLAGAPSIDKEYYLPYLEGSGVKLIQNQTYPLLNNAELALVTSGTATLETALFEVPQVVCYKANNISYQIAKRLVKLDYISLVNLIMDKELVKELIQDDLNEKQLQIEIDKILPETATRAQMLEQYKALKEVLGGAGASEEVAKSMYQEVLELAKND
jgi:lipid-A-disaccharide synthase